MPEEHVTDIERDLAALLEIEPSPQFAPRLRERIAGTPGSRSWMPWALAAASIVLVAAGWLTMRAPVTRVEQASVSASRAPLGRSANLLPKPATPTPLQSQSQAFGEARARRGAATPEVIVDPALGVAVQRLMRGSWSARTDVAILVTVPAEGAPVDLAVAPVAVDQLAVPEIAVGGPQFGAPR